MSDDYHFDIDEEMYYTIMDALRHARDDAVHGEGSRLFLEAEDELREQKQAQHSQEADDAGD